MSINLKDFNGAWKKGFYFLFTLSIFTFLPFGKQAGLLAQPKDNAPYSRFGLGEPIYPTLSSAGFGGLTAAYADPLHINLQNPASLGLLAATAFEVGVFAEHATLQSGDQTSSAWGGNLSHIALAFPMRNPLNDLLAKKQRKVFWAMNLALLPNTAVGYDILTETVLTEGDTTSNSFQGTGGTNKFVWGNGIRYKNFSAGMNLSYQFGQLETSREVTFINRESVFNDIYKDDISVRSLIWSAGAQYRIDIKKKLLEDGSTRPDRSLIVGFYGNPATNFNTESSVLRSASHSILNITDTLLYETGLKQEGKLPSEWTFGLMYQHEERLRIGAEFSAAKWSKYVNEAKPEQLTDSRRFAFGVEYSPDRRGSGGYIERVRYRAGFYHRTDPRLEDLQQTALTFGLGLPLILPRGQTSFINLGVELGRYDTPDAIDEKFVKMSIGFTLNDNSWFYKRKFG